VEKKLKMIITFAVYLAWRCVELQSCCNAFFNIFKILPFNVFF